MENMAHDEISFNKQALEGISEGYSNIATQISHVQESVLRSITNIKDAWYGDQEDLAGRDKDLNCIQENIGKIAANLISVSKYLNEKNENFQKINYK